MDPQPGDADVFRAGIAPVLSTLTDAIDDETATTIIRFALLAVGKDAEKLKILVIVIYNSTTPSSKCVAKLLLKLLELTPLDIQANVTKTPGKVASLASFELNRSFLLDKCQTGFETTITKAVWSPKPIMVAVALFQARHMTRGIIGKKILGGMADSDHLFVPENFELFINTCFSCGPRLDDLGYKIDQLTAVINRVSARVPAESTVFKFAMIGLVAARDNDWIIKTNTAPPVSSETDSLTELEIVA